MYQHQWTNGNAINLPVGKVVCVGRNYVDHVHELNNEMPSEPLLFIKPATALVELEQTIVLPRGQGACHNELEFAILIGERLTKANKDDAFNSIVGVGLGLDLTLRDVQNNLKAKGLPWERAKAFDNSCPMSGFIDIDKIDNIQNLNMQLQVNQQVRQQGNSQMMIWPVADLLSEISHVFSLLPGDIVLTGTPKGVGPLLDGDQLTVELRDHFTVTTTVATTRSQS